MLKSEERTDVEGYLFCVTREVNGVEVTVIERYVTKKYARGRRGAYGVLEREISIENRFFPSRNRDFSEVLVSGIF